MSSKFSFTISATDMQALTGVSQQKEYVFDRGLTRTVQHRILKASFGDGYEQRAIDGINGKMDSFNVSFNNRPAEDINIIAAYFDMKAGKGFDLSITNHVGDEIIRVVCENYNISYAREEVHSITAMLRRVYEP